MSQSTAKMDKGKNVATAPAPSVPTALAGTAVHLYRPSAMMLGGLGGQMFGAKSLGVVGHTIATTLKLFKAPDMTEYVGFMLEIPLGESNKDTGFGMTHWGTFSHLLAQETLMLISSASSGSVSFRVY